MTIAEAPAARAHAQALANLIARYDGRSPRYTSYPTAVQFTPAVDQAAYRGWLAALPADTPVSLYAHIPFCARICWYCGCNTRAMNRPEPISDYVGLLVREAEMLGEALPARLAANAIHLGGGSPNMLSADDMDALFDGLGRVFRLTPDREVSVEIDPARLTRDWVQAAAGHGLTRASLGVQNLDARVQAAVNRSETEQQVEQAVGWLREVGVRSINVDLMYGLPHQTTTNTLATLDSILRLAPERIALFGYAHVPWMKANQQLIEEDALPGPAARLDQAETAAEHLVAAGYVRVGLDHFARPGDELAQAASGGRLHRNFQGYTTDAAETLLGLGASAIGRLPQGFVQNAAQELAWRTAVREGRLPVARGVAFTDDDRLRGEIIERLMCDLAVDVGAVAARHGRDPGELDGAMARLSPFVADGLARIEGRRLQVVGDGRLVIRSICAVFDAYFDPEAGRHSRSL
ncbi:MAG: oxygen-independent coproporphyrinogen III oxidase [Phenylobacterium sp.]|uniref:oxygen-independent coproporphyrinogen III oxidase n=1 Tax=Phenylobacterium sp. TaxID=1871053 RepID=UPI0025E41793|nr:oxygen-independent coproporphyrinogen III oxidase [Phenylobacterium sp.]MBI1199240.1 oxygen-independent coproporphyrinogen III oxidase [Phenylobacterium sp.]